MKPTRCPGLCRTSSCLPMALLFAVICGCGAAFRRKDCLVPEPPDHTIYRCMSPACKRSLGGSAVKAGSVLQYDCKAGYVLASPPGVSVCRGGQWSMPKPVICKPLAGSPAPRSGALLAVSSIPVVAAASVTISALLLVAMVCVLVGPKPRSPSCWRWYERMEEPEMSSVDSYLVPLPSYEEAVYGSQGEPVPPAAPAPTPLVLSRDPAPVVEAVESRGSPGVATPPPSYQESQVAAAGGPILAQPLPLPARFLFPEAGKDQDR
ncbi:sushi domain-containing protein 6-like [Carettochelys insculpta]|uniref:sushi domain-containing protein 6-like n=1 Tax=Carettochelys insculpta TaxID=44489 RepID=UPI003EB7F015